MTGTGECKDEFSEDLGEYIQLTTATDSEEAQARRAVLREKWKNNAGFISRADNVDQMALRQIVPVAIFSSPESADPEPGVRATVELLLKHQAKTRELFASGQLKIKP